MKKRNKSASKRRDSARRTSRTLGAKMEALEPRAMLASDLNAWHNPNQALDVNNDQLIDDNDLQIMLSQLTQGSLNYANSVQRAGGLEGEQILFLDVNNDGQFNPLDLNMLVTSLIEGEAADESFSAGFDFEIFQNGVSLGMTSTGFTVDPITMEIVPISNVLPVTIAQGDFELVVYVRNTSHLTGGTLNSPNIASAYVDINYDPAFISPSLVEPIPGLGIGEVLPPFGEGGVATTVGGPGLVQNAGGVSSVDDLDLNGGGWQDPQELFRITFTPTQPGTFRLYGSEAIGINDDGNPATEDENQSAIYFTDLNDFTIQTLVFPQIDVTVLPADGANNDVVGASADLIEEIEADDDNIVVIGGVTYLVIDAKANDTNATGDPLVGTEQLSPTVTAVTSLTTDADLESRVMLATDPIADLPMLSNQYYLYRLPTDLSGAEVFQYTLTDGMSTTTATVTINISPVLVAVDDGDALAPFATVTTGTTVTLNVLENDYIVGDGQVIPTANITIVSVAGTAALEDRVEISADGKSLIYTGGTTLGIETFTYTINYVDDNLVTHEDTATVSIRVPIDSLISGGFYFDANYDGVWNDNAGNNASPEQFIGGLQVSLYQGATLVGTTFSSEADGSFGFAAIDAGTYTVKIAAPKFVYKYGTGLPGGLPPNVSVDANGTITLSNITISAGNLKPAAFGIGFIGRTAAYRGPNDSISGVGETSILFAVSKQPNNQGNLEWYSPDQGWGPLVKVDGLVFNTASKTGQAVLIIDQDNDPLTDPVIAPITFSLNDPNFLLIADTSDAVIFRLIGGMEAIVDRLSSVDIAFSQI